MKRRYNVQGIFKSKRWFLSRRIPHIREQDSNRNRRKPECPYSGNWPDDVKPSGFSYGQCSEENITITDFQGNLQEGLYKPTRESTLHGNLYARYPKIGGIVHTHSPYSILISLNDRQLELITLHSQLKLKKPVKVVDVTTQAVTQEELPKVFKVLDTEPETAAIILKGHGIVAISSSAVKAGQIAELIEETAMIAWEQKKLRK